MGRAIIAVTLSLFPHDAIVDAPGHWDGDVWVEPERRYNLGMLRNALELPDGWSFLKGPYPTVWIDPLGNLLKIGVESDRFPDAPPGEMAPHIIPVYHVEYGTDGTRQTCFDGFDMHEVESLQARLAATAH